jgi:hypothetical protein
MPELTDKFAEAYKSVIEGFKPSKLPKMWVTVSPDGKRAGLAVYNGVVGKGWRSGMTNYEEGWYVTDDMRQIKYEIGVDIDRAFMHYSDKYEAPLMEFWGNYSSMKDLPDMGMSPIERSYLQRYSKDRSQAGLGTDILAALLTDGFSKQDFIQLAQKSEGTNSKWEQFKQIADSIADRHLPTLDRIDSEMSMWRADEAAAK